MAVALHAAADGPVFHHIEDGEQANVGGDAGPQLSDSNAGIRSGFLQRTLMSASIHWWNTGRTCRVRTRPTTRRLDAVRLYPNPNPFRRSRNPFLPTVFEIPWLCAQVT
jgi:hypothetical protein